MRIPAASLDSATPFTYAVAVQKIAQNQAKQDGTQIVALIENAAPPVGLHGEGTHINTYA
jgi:hypothetical protein